MNVSNEKNLEKKQKISENDEKSAAPKAATATAGLSDELDQLLGNAALKKLTRVKEKRQQTFQKRIFAPPINIFPAAATVEHRILVG